MKTALLFAERLAAVTGIGLSLIIVGYWLVVGTTADTWLGLALFLGLFALVAGIWTVFSRVRTTAKEAERLKAKLTEIRASQLSATP